MGKGIEEGLRLLGIYRVRENFHPHMVSALPKREDMQIGRYAKVLKGCIFMLVPVIGNQFSGTQDIFWNPLLIEM